MCNIPHAHAAKGDGSKPALPACALHACVGCYYTTRHVLRAATKKASVRACVCVCLCAHCIRFHTHERARALLTHSSSRLEEELWRWCRRGGGKAGVVVGDDGGARHELTSRNLKFKPRIPFAIFAKSVSNGVDKHRERERDTVVLVQESTDTQIGTHAAAAQLLLRFRLGDLI